MLSFSPYAQISEVPPIEVLECALYVMYRWGHIKCFRFDNGRPFGDPKRRNISPCALNLIARDCEVLFNSPRSPTQNAKVERCQGTTGKWSDPKNCANIKEFIKSLDYAVLAQRQRLRTRVCNGKTRAEYYPSLFKNPRKYNPQDFDIQRVYKFLTTGKWFRRISKIGQIEMFGKRYQAGYSIRGKDVAVTLQIEGQTPFWCCFDEKQQLVAKIHAHKIIDKVNFL